MKARIWLVSMMFSILIYPLDTAEEGKEENNEFKYMRLKVVTEIEILCVRLLQFISTCILVVSPLVTRLYHIHCYILNTNIHLSGPFISVLGSSIFLSVSLCACVFQYFDMLYSNMSSRRQIGTPAHVSRRPRRLLWVPHVPANREEVQNLVNGKINYH